jgi:hypothetical protein
LSINTYEGSDTEKSIFLPSTITIFGEYKEKNYQKNNIKIVLCIFSIDPIEEEKKTSNPNYFYENEK